MEESSLLKTIRCIRKWAKHRDTPPSMFVTAKLMIAARNNPTVHL